MKLISWNVNGLRACAGKGFFDFFQQEQADIFCLQETKMQQEQADFDFSSYREYWNSAEKKGYSGTAIFSRTVPKKVTYGLGLPEHDREGRVITAYYDQFALVNVYTPNSQKELARLDYRMHWEDAFRFYVTRLDQEIPVIICGDLNVAHTEQDLKNPSTNRRNAGFTDEERSKLSTLLESGFLDTFRFLHPDVTEAYTWWSYMFKARSRNAGWRIDYFLLSRRLEKHLHAAHIYADILGSDHCPVGLELNLPPT